MQTHCAKCLRAPRPYEDHVQQQSFTSHFASTLCRRSVCRPPSRQGFSWRQLPRRRLFYKPHPLLPLSQFCSSTIVPPRLLLELNSQATFSPEWAHGRGQCADAKKIISWERYGATAKQIITPIQLYDLQLLVFLHFS